MTGPEATSALDQRAGGRRDVARVARAYLLRVAEPPAEALVELVERVGPVEAAERVRSAEVSAEVAALTSARRTQDRAVADLEAAAAVGARLVVPEDPDWPSMAFVSARACGFAHLAPPLALWVRGPARLSEVVERSVAIVGARAASGYGEHVATDLAHGVASRACTVVSGAAYGIDGHAHRGALVAGGTTVAVLACGLDRSYPAGHARLLDRIAEVGLVVSEYAPGTVPARHRFLVRNRLIAALAVGTVVVEAGWRSGARRTASDAALLGRAVMAVPGPVTSALSVGCHRLLRDCGAVAVTRAEEVLEAIGRIGDDLAPPPGGAGVRAIDRLGPAAARVYDALPPSAGRPVTGISMESGLPVEVVRAVLPELEALGLIARADAGWCRARPVRRGGA